MQFQVSCTAGQVFVQWFILCLFLGLVVNYSIIRSGYMSSAPYLGKPLTSEGLKIEPGWRLGPDGYYRYFTCSGVCVGRISSDSFFATHLGKYAPQLHSDVCLFDTPYYSESDDGTCNSDSLGGSSDDGA